MHFEPLPGTRTVGHRPSKGPELVRYAVVLPVEAGRPIRAQGMRKKWQNWQHGCVKPFVDPLSKPASQTATALMSQ
jgi:hypothetical protein